MSIRTTIHGIARDTRLSFREVDVLMYLREKSRSAPARTNMAMVTAMGYSPSRITRTVDMLERKGWADRVQGEDLRQPSYALTPDGMTLANKIAGGWR